MVAYVYVVEFEKRGIPHVRFLIILKQSYKLKSPEEYDHVVYAEVQDKEENPHLHAAVVKHMIHAPCGELNTTNVCINNKNHRCKNKYPKQFSSFTTHGQQFLSKIQTPR